MSAHAYFPTDSVYRVARTATTGEPPTKGTVSPWIAGTTPEPWYPGFDIAVVEFDEAGGFLVPHQLDAAVAAIEAARLGEGGAVQVVLFVHGWMGSAAWTPDPQGGSWDPEDGNRRFRQFRRTLMHLAVRDMERERGRRRVVGVYVGWPGDETSTLWDLLASFDSFARTYDVAALVGKGAMVETVRRITEAVKHPADPAQPKPYQMSKIPESTLVLVGHSMGALVLEAAFLELLQKADPFLIWSPGPEDDRRDPVRQQMNGKDVRMPDLLLALNSAADAQILAGIGNALDRLGFQKRVRVDTPKGPMDYAAPVVISATGTWDLATKWIWPAARRMLGERAPSGDRDAEPAQDGANDGSQERVSTDGHAAELRTHALTLLSSRHYCDPINPFVDLGQAWHCLRVPEPRESMPGEMPRFDIDLPTRESDRTSHRRFRLAPEPRAAASPYCWIFPVPYELVAGHSDIDSARVSLFSVAMIQISGAAMSLAEDFRDNFEEETG